MRINCDLITSNLKQTAIVTGTIVLCGTLWGIPSAVTAAVTLGATFYTQKKTQKLEEMPLLNPTKETEIQTDPLTDQETDTIPILEESDEKLFPQKNEEKPVTAARESDHSPKAIDDEKQPEMNALEENDAKKGRPLDEEEQEADFEKIESAPICKSLTDFTSLKPINDAQKDAIQEIMGVVAPLSASLGAYYYNHIEKLVQKTGLKAVHPLSYLEYVFTTTFTDDVKKRLKEGFGTWYGGSFTKHVDGKTLRELFIKICSHDGKGLEGSVSTPFKKQFLASLSNAFNEGIFPLDGFAKAIGKPEIDEGLKVAASTQKWDEFLRLLIS